MCLDLIKSPPSLISKHQNGFVPSRHLLDSIILIHENIHYLSINKKPSFLLKLDLLKACDRVNWNFLIKVLRSFGFENSSSSLLISVCLLLNFQFWSISLCMVSSWRRGVLDRGILSPLSFLFWWVKLSAKLSKEKSERATCWVYDHLPKLLFSPTNNLWMIPCWWGKALLKKKKLLKLSWIYEKGFGQKVILSKSFIFFMNTPEKKKFRISNILGCKMRTLLDFYFGLPLCVGPTPDSFWSSLIDRFQNKLVGWKVALLSQACKLQLIRASLQNLLIYAMSLFKIPTRFVDRMERIEKHFLWSGTEFKSRLHLVSWD